MRLLRHLKPVLNHRKNHSTFNPEAIGKSRKELIKSQLHEPLMARAHISHKPTFQDINRKRSISQSLKRRPNSNSMMREISPLREGKTKPQTCSNFTMRFARPTGLYQKYIEKFIAASPSETLRKALPHLQDQAYTSSTYRFKPQSNSIISFTENLTTRPTISSKR